MTHTKHSCHFRKNRVVQCVFPHLQAGIFKQKRILPITERGIFNHNRGLRCAESSGFNQNCPLPSAEGNGFNKNRLLPSAEGIGFNQNCLLLSAEGAIFKQKYLFPHLLKALMPLVCRLFCVKKYKLSAKNFSGKIIYSFIHHPGSFLNGITPGTKT